MALTDEDKLWITGQLTALDAKIEKVETALLTEFHKWASPHDARLRTHTAALRTFDLDLEALTERVKRLEDQRPH